ncbi:hypothetical protein DFJ58DRAFT_245334 [Suillus subalutaceus]|uniref:uncharacterized protein n=1 Tax=Suillus subalutaceus TaxID=48586 RepID=UPI001B85E509|nr:uncharacterized protein DFJ58DRAFT_245334 [Suillus subalutaceus]KAG1861728.1 hypothetical protein DFJ58DRAFT_245334 [Suillus subalutaceus]
MGCQERQNSPGSNRDWAQGGVHGDILARQHKNCDRRIQRLCSEHLGCKDGRADCHTQTWIFDTATWKQIATLEGHTDYVNLITLSQNNRLLVSTSNDKTACIWNLDTNLSIGPPLQHEEEVECAALSADGKVLVTGNDKNVYTWDVQAILKNAGLEDLLLPIPHVLVQKQPMNNNATRRPPIHARRIPPRFFDDMQGDIHSSTSHDVHPPSSHRILAPSIGNPPIQLNPNKPRGEESSLFALLVLSKLLQYETESPCLWLRGPKKRSSRAASLMAGGRHRNLNLPLLRRLQHNLFQMVTFMLPHHVQ